MAVYRGVRGPVSGQMLRLGEANAERLRGGLHVGRCCQLEQYPPADRVLGLPAPSARSTSATSIGSIAM